MSDERARGNPSGAAEQPGAALPLALLVSPLARGAFFNEYLAVAQAELASLTGSKEVLLRQVGGLDWLELEAPADALPEFARLACVQGIFERRGDQLTPLAVDPGFALDQDFVTGPKFRGKTNELLTQLLINVGLHTVGAPNPAGLKLLDPMCGRATTGLWAMRYGMRSRGIEQDPGALADIRRNVKKYCKLHRTKHSLKEGFVGRSNRKGEGRFLDFEAGGTAMRVITGDSIDARELLRGETFHLIVSDLPYGVQHGTSPGTRNPLPALEACASGWAQSLRPGGALVLAFNSFQPRRAALLELFAQQGLDALDFSAAHRMSESILRDVVVLKKPARQPSGPGATSEASL